MSLRPVAESPVKKGIEPKDSGVTAVESVIHVVLERMGMEEAVVSSPIIVLLEMGFFC